MSVSPTLTWVGLPEPSKQWEAVSTVLLLIRVPPHTTCNNICNTKHWETFRTVCQLINVPPHTTCRCQ